MKERIALKTRKATVRDALAIHALIMRNAREGSMLPRSMNEIYERIRSFFVIEIDGQIQGCCCLHVMWDDLAEVKSLSVAPEYQGMGMGRALIEEAMIEARELEVTRVFALTFIPGYFEKFGFKKVDMNELPKKIWIECVNCVNYPDCNEIAVIRPVD